MGEAWQMYAVFSPVAVAGGLLQDVLRQISVTRVTRGGDGVPCREECGGWRERREQAHIHLEIEMLIGDLAVSTHI